MSKNFFSLASRVKILLATDTNDTSNAAEENSIVVNYILPIFIAHLVGKLFSEESSSIIETEDTDSSKKTYDTSEHKHESKSIFSFPSLEYLSSIVGELTTNKTEGIRTAPATSSTPYLYLPRGNGVKTTPIGRKSPSELGLQGELPDRGSYTKEEASIILDLKSSGADTSASKTKIHPKIEELIRSKAAEYGVNQDIAVKIAIVESGGNPNAISSTGAIGIFQFTGATANLMGLVNRFNAIDNIDAGIRLLVSDTRFVGSFNSDVATYLALQIGGPNAKYVLTSDRSTKISELPSKVQKAVRGNLGGKSATLGGYIDANKAALEEKILAQKSKPVYAPTSIPAPPTNKPPNTSLPSAISKPNSSTQVSSPTLSSKPPSSVVAASTKSPVTTPVKETTPTTVEPTYKPTTSAPDVSKSKSTPTNNTSSSSQQPSPTLDGVIKHKSGLYFNVA